MSVAMSPSPVCVCHVLSYLLIHNPYFFIIIYLLPTFTFPATPLLLSNGGEDFVGGSFLSCLHIARYPQSHLGLRAAAIHEAMIAHDLMFLKVSSFASNQPWVALFVIHMYVIFVYIYLYICLSIYLFFPKFYMYFIIHVYLFYLSDMFTQPLPV